MLPGFARSEIFRIMLFSMPRRNGGGWNSFNAALPPTALMRRFSRRDISRLPERKVTDPTRGLFLFGSRASPARQPRRREFRVANQRFADRFDRARDRTRESNP